MKNKFIILRPHLMPYYRCAKKISKNYPSVGLMMFVCLIERVSKEKYPEIESKDRRIQKFLVNYLNIKDKQTLVTSFKKANSSSFIDVCKDINDEIKLNTATASVSHMLYKMRCGFAHDCKLTTLARWEKFNGKYELTPLITTYDKSQPPIWIYIDLQTLIRILERAINKIMREVMTH